MKVVCLSVLVSGLLLVPVLISPAFASTLFVSLPPDVNGFVQIEAFDFGGITMSGQTLSVDFVFSKPMAEMPRAGTVLSEILLQTGPHSGAAGDYPYNQYVVLGSGTSAYMLDDNRLPLNIPMWDWRGAQITGPAPTAGVISTPRGWAGGDAMGFYPQGARFGGVHYDMVLPNTGETLYLGRLALKFQPEGPYAAQPGVAPSAPPPVVDPAPITWQAPAPVVDPTPIVWTPPAPVVEPAPIVWTPPAPVVESAPIVWTPPSPNEPTMFASPSSGTSFAFENFGGVTRTTDGAGPFSTMFARIHAAPGSTTPSAVAVLKYRMFDTLVSEPVVQDSPAIRSGRMYAEATPDGIVNTAVAIVNPNPEDATVSFELTNVDGNVFQTGTFTLKGSGASCDSSSLCSRLSTFIDQYPFFSGTNVRGTLTFASTAPIAVAAFRTLRNERTPGELLMSPLPVIDLSIGVTEVTRVLPYFSVGNGMTTQVVLVNPTGTALQGWMLFMDSSGVPQELAVNGEPATSPSFFVAPNSSQKYLLANLSPGTESGSIWILPLGSVSPVPLAIVGYRPEWFTIYEASVPATSGPAFRLYAQLASSPRIVTGVSIANTTGSAGNVFFSLTGLDGAPLAISGPVALPSFGQVQRFLTELFPELTGSTLRGVLRITTDLPNISVVGLHGEMNDRRPSPDFMVSSMPPTLENALPNSGDRFFPYVLNGDASTTEFILFSGTAGQASQGTLDFYQYDGTPVSLPLR